jgi:ABC-type bacteriocin/lantibiotic exporter with double-glycine peptidase domain
VVKEMMLDVPQGQQSYSYDCGAKALHLVLAYYGEEVPYKNLLKVAKRHNVYGMTEKEMEALAHRHGLKTESKINWTLDEIKKHIRQGEPVIVLLQGWADNKLTKKEWERTNDYGHYAIVVGFDEGRVILNDPLSFRKVWLTEDEFKAKWHGDEADNLPQYAFVAYGKKPVIQKYEHMDIFKSNPIRYTPPRKIKRRNTSVKSMPSLGRIK